MRRNAPIPTIASQKADKQLVKNAPVWVQCEGYRCLAVLDHKGRWKAYATHKELSGVVKVIPAQQLSDFNFSF